MGNSGYIRMKDESRYCSNCVTQIPSHSDDIQRCKKCYLVTYCSLACYSSHILQHKKTCDAMSLGKWNRLVTAL